MPEPAAAGPLGESRPAADVVHVIGLSGERLDALSGEARAAISSARVLVGGRRHLTWWRDQSSPGGDGEPRQLREPARDQSRLRVVARPQPVTGTGGERDHVRPGSVPAEEYARVRTQLGAEGAAATEPPIMSLDGSVDQVALEEQLEEDASSS